MNNAEKTAAQKAEFLEFVERHFDLPDLFNHLRLVEELALYTGFEHPMEERERIALYDVFRMHRQLERILYPDREPEELEDLEID